MNPKPGKYEWNAHSIQALRRHMGLSQQEMAAELGIRQQTVSEWETDRYRPRGGMITLLTMVAERVSFLPQDAGSPEVPDNWPEQPITRLALKPRATAALQQAGLPTIAAVVARWRENRQGLLDIPDFGERSLQDLEQKLRDLGLIY